MNNKKSSFAGTNRRGLRVFFFPHLRIAIVRIAIWMVVASGFMAGAHADTKPVDPATKAAVCGGCHGAEGNSAVPNFPKLAGQQQQYLAKQLVDFKSGARTDAMMAGMVAGLSESDITTLTTYYAERVRVVPMLQPGHSAIGEALYQRGNTALGIAPCAACHGTQGHGYPGFMPGGVPAVAGQHAAYTSKQLRAFRAGGRANDRNSMMRHVATRLSEEDIDAVALYISGLRP